ncbi:unnamed protein product [Trifolium pratense]|uniref:Uncharacterized protein n=1 Tax=Trifolium pratense TaxID=57577 RepID=A0ACB0IGZ5_TRIPR|nr:unnamed protein product [Trifolium pratense]
MITTSVKPLSFDYQGFKYDDVKPEGDASLLYSYIQLTSTSRYQTNTYSVGRVTCFEPLQLWDKTSRKLIYEFMQNGSLDSHLYRGKSLLTWPMRYNIAMDLASALLYLHEEWEQCVIHRDIKSSNIMLDYNFNAKLGDFGMARLVDHEKESQSTTIIAGTMGYIAPEYYTTGKATKESDIYSFGIVSLELASGRKPIDLNAKEDQVTIFDWVRELYRLGRFLEVVDTKLEGIFDEEQMERLVVIGLWCANPNYSFRPSARQVIQVLKFEAPLPILQHMMLESIYSPKTMNTIFGPVSSSFVEDDFDVHKVTR